MTSAGADLGLAFDGDADRCFVVDERGSIVSPSVLTALIAVRELRREPGATIIHNLITSRAVPEIVIASTAAPPSAPASATSRSSRPRWRSAGAVFGGEHSGHFYFRDFWFADSGMLAAMHVLAALGAGTRPLSGLLAEYSRYVATGEINSEVVDQAATTARIRAAFARLGFPGLSTDELRTALTVSAPDWWFNVRGRPTPSRCSGSNAEARRCGYPGWHPRRGAGYGPRWLARSVAAQNARLAGDSPRRQ